MIELVSDERSIAAARALIREHFDANSEAHTPAQIDSVIERLPAPYVPPAGGLWIAWEDGEAAGCVALQPLSPGTCEMKRMYVRPLSRGKGIARALGIHLIAEARAKRYERLRLGTLTTMQPAQNLYSSLGFRPIAPYRNEEFGATVFYELDLTGTRP